MQLNLRIIFLESSFQRRGSFISFSLHVLGSYSFPHVEFLLTSVAFSSILGVEGLKVTWLGVVGS